MVRILRLTKGVISAGFYGRTGLPKLNIPQRAPARPRQRFLLALVIYLISDRPTGHVSQRELALLQSRSGRDSVAERLHILRVSGFLRRTKRRLLADADVYLPGRKLTRKYHRQWVNLSQTLFGRKGLCEKLYERPAFAHRLLGMSGMLILATVRNSQIPLTVREIQEYLSFLVGSETTVRQKLIKAESAGLVKRNGSSWHKARDFQANLRKYEHQHHAFERQERTRAQFDQQRRQFALSLYGHKVTPQQEKTLKKRGCIRCGASNATCLAKYEKGLSIEHFPPRKWLQAWKIEDHPDFAWAICPPENSRYGRQVRKMAAPTLDKFIQISLRKPEDLERVVLAKLEFSIRRFYKALDNRDRLVAGRIAASAASLWIAATTDLIPLNVIVPRPPKLLGRRRMRHTKRTPKLTGARWTDDKLRTHRTENRRQHGRKINSRHIT